MARPTRERRPWWLQGEERCAFCQERYVYEMEIRCVACDRPVCPVCVVTVRERRERTCPDCVPDDGGEGS